MIQDKKYPSGLIDADSAPHILPADALLDMKNMRLVSGKDGDIGYFKSIQGNTLQTDSFQIPDGSTAIGGCFDPTGTYVVWLTKNVNPDYDQINYFDVVKKEYWLVMRSDMDAIGKVYGGLRFTNYVHSIHIINNTLYWTDNNEEPRKLHIGAAIRATHPTLDETPLYPGWQYSWLNAPYAYVDKSAITTICKPPTYPPMLTKSFDASIVNNFILDDSFQFAMQYEYYSGERSVLSLWSETSNLNYKNEKNNCITVYLKQDDVPIPSTVRSLRLIVKVHSTKRSFVVRVWDKEIDVDLLKIQSFAAGGSLSYRFFNKYLGEAVDDNTATKLFDSVPLIAEGQAIIKNRLFYSNTVEGYDAPKRKSSLQLEIPENSDWSGTGIVVKPYWGVFHWLSYAVTKYYYGWFVYLTEGDAPGVTQTGYYSINSSVVTSGPVGADLDTLPNIVILSDLTYHGINPEGVFEHISGTSYGSSVLVMRLTSSRTHPVRLNTSGVVAGNTQKALLYNSEVHAAVVFYDKYLRRCSVVVPHNYDDPAVLPGTYGGKVYLPIRDAVLSKMYSFVNWKLSNDNSIEEIPEWAFYYSIVQKDKDRIGYFISGVSTESYYAKRQSYINDEGEEKNMVYKFEDQTFSDKDTAALAIDTSSLVNEGLGYIYSPGDICVIVKESNNAKYELPVIGQFGKYILVSAKDIGDMSGSGFRLLYEIYTPIKSENQQVFFEIGQLYPVYNPGTNNRSYSSLSGIIDADTWLIFRKFNSVSYYAQAMSPNDNFYRSWATNYGKANVVTNLGQAKKPTNISFGNTYIPGGAVNGMSSFEALNETNLSPEFGPIRKLITTSKVTGEGNVLVAVCENATASIYIDEAEISDQQGNSTLVKSENVIGQINELRGGYGTKHPESVAELNGNVFWWDTKRAAILKYAANGLFPLSDNKLKTATYKLSLKTGSDILVLGGIDPYNDEYLLQPLFSDNNSGDYRVRFSGNNTIVVCISESKSRGVDEYYTEGMVTNGRDVYAFKNGHLWMQEDSVTHSLFFGQIVEPSIAIASNPAGPEMKVFESIGIKSNVIPGVVTFKTEDPSDQETDLLGSDFTTREGIFYAAMLRDVHSPNTPGTVDEKRLSGDKLRGTYLFVRLNFQPGVPIRLKEININYNLSAGHGNR